jgi:hypothetical protein
MTSFPRHRRSASKGLPAPVAGSPYNAKLATDAIKLSLKLDWEIGNNGSMINEKRGSKMYVVRTVSQLKDALKERVREVMVVGMLAPKMLELSSGSSENVSYEFSRDLAIAELFNNFDIHTVRDRSQTVIATVFQKRTGTWP